MKDLYHYFSNKQKKFYPIEGFVHCIFLVPVLLGLAFYVTFILYFIEKFPTCITIFCDRDAASFLVSVNGVLHAIAFLQKVKLYLKSP